ncbi:putative transcriptional regulator [Desulfamplus magnetovallimortis]|uniref:Putative transcriptional regulator n=1 Tax=Desulfamplus magnetovallimortis TaxID=1246637 RepID=A0A1W1HAS5_9BACT|nr:RNA-binding domain-containing protein [Desulfamplus magnetovallimortis]SLM29543.1 putative transcriptional regulator [Desulfamplus magnetovallimortis]
MISKEDLIKRLKKYEWNDFECKKAQRGVPEDAYKTVSAFANTTGGYLVFGVKDEKGNLDIVGVLDVDKVQNDFLSTLRGGKLNRIIAVQEDKIEHDGNTLLTFFVPEANRNEKPVYLKGDIRQSYIRRGAGDEQCTQNEIEQFIRDASQERYDSQVMYQINADKCFDENTVSWYRDLFNRHQPDRHAALNHIEFLHEWGFISEDQNKIYPTRAGVLLFGKAMYVRQILPRPVLDYQRIDFDFHDWMPEKRWHDRVVFEENIFQTWMGLFGKYMRVADRPFSVDSETLRRNDDPPDYISFRESAINLLIHQDYGDHTRKPSIRLFKDRTIFWNPGDAFATFDELLSPKEKEVRNPSIVSAFRRIGLSDQAGTGIRTIYRNWHALGHVPPKISNNKSGKDFQIALLKQILLSEEQILIQSRIGAHLSEEQAAVFAFACRSESLTITIQNIKAITAKRNSECEAIADHLVVQSLLHKFSSGLYSVAEHLKPIIKRVLFPENEDENIDSTASVQVKSYSAGNIVDSSAQVNKITDTQKDILDYCEVARSLTELLEKAGFTNRGYFKKNHINPLINSGLLAMTKPDKPRAKNQKYILTEPGLQLVLLWKKESAQVEDK